MLGLGSAKARYWASGIREHQGEFFIFTNVGMAGATPGEAVNRWDGKHLLWHHKKKSHLSWPSVKKLVDAGQAHVFWRSSSQDMFEYAGYGKKEKVEDRTPVEITWAFEHAPSRVPHPREYGAVGGDSPETGGVPAITVGMRARHQGLGVGRVLEVSGSGEDASALLFLAGPGERHEVPVSELEKMAGFGPA